METPHDAHEPAQPPPLRPYLLGGVGLTAFWAVLAYPIVVTVGWGFLVQLVLIGWAAFGFSYWLQRRRHRSTQQQTPAPRSGDADR